MSARRFSLPKLPSNGRQARMGLVMDVRLLHLSLNTLQMAAPRVAIWFPPSNGVGACTVAVHALPTQNFYKRDAHCISRLTFS